MFAAINAFRWPHDSWSNQFDVLRLPHYERGEEHDFVSREWHVHCCNFIGRLAPEALLSLRPPALFFDGTSEFSVLERDELFFFFQHLLI